MVVLEMFDKSKTMELDFVPMKVLTIYITIISIQFTFIDTCEYQLNEFC